jgi:hypothetical protein
VDFKGRVRPTSDRELLSKPGKRVGVVSVEQRVPQATQMAGNQGDRVVFGCEEAPSKDEGMPSVTECILHSKGETLPDNVAVIPYTTMYATNTESIILDLYCMESDDEQ